MHSVALNVFQRISVIGILAGPTMSLTESLARFEVSKRLRPTPEEMIEYELEQPMAGYFRWPARLTDALHGSPAGMIELAEEERELIRTAYRVLAQQGRLQISFMELETMRLFFGDDELHTLAERDDANRQ